MILMNEKEIQFHLDARNDHAHDFRMGKTGGRYQRYIFDPSSLREVLQRIFKNSSDVEAFFFSHFPEDAKKHWPMHAGYQQCLNVLVSCIEAETIIDALLNDPIYQDRLVPTHVYSAIKYKVSHADLDGLVYAHQEAAKAAEEYRQKALQFSDISVLQEKINMTKDSLQKREDSLSLHKLELDEKLAELQKREAALAESQSQHRQEEEKATQRKMLLTQEEVALAARQAVFASEMKDLREQQERLTSEKARMRHDLETAQDAKNAAELSRRQGEVSERLARQQKRHAITLNVALLLAIVVVTWSVWQALPLRMQAWSQPAAATPPVQREVYMLNSPLPLGPTTTPSVAPTVVAPVAVPATEQKNAPSRRDKLRVAAPMKRQGLPHPNVRADCGCAAGDALGTPGSGPIPTERKSDPTTYGEPGTSGVSH